MTGHSHAEGDANLNFPSRETLLAHLVERHHWPAVHRWPASSGDLAELHPLLHGGDVDRAVKRMNEILWPEGRPV